MQQARIMRSAGLGCGLVLLCSISLLGFVTGFNPQNLRAWWQSLSAIATDPQYFTGLVEADEFLSFLAETQSNMSLVTYSVDTQGQISDEASAIFLNADQARPMAALSDLLLLAVYAHQVETGSLDPEEAVTLAAWERYYLPNSDSRGHAQALAAINIETDQRGMAKIPEQHVHLDDIVQAMMRYGDYAASDYLLQRFEPAAIQELLTLANLAHLPYPQPRLGMFLSWRNHKIASQDVDQAQVLSALSPQEKADLWQEMQTAYQDEAWRQAEIDWRLSAGRINNLAYEKQMAHQDLPQGSARDIAQLMALISQGQFISPEISAIMARHLEFPAQDTDIQQLFTRLASKSGVQPGIISEAIYLLPSTGDFADQVRVSVILMEDLPVSAYIRLRQTFSYQKFSAKAARERSFISEIQNILQE